MKNGYITITVPISSISENQANKIVLSGNETDEELEAISLLTGGKYFEKIKKPSEEYIKEMISRDSGFIFRVSNPSRDLCLYAAKRNGMILLKTKKEYLTDDFLIEVIKANPDAFNYIRNPSEKVQLAAVSAFPKLYSIILNPSKNVIYKMLEADRGDIVVNWYERIPENIKRDVYKRIISDRPNLIFNLKDATTEDIVLAINSDPSIAKNIRTNNNEIILAAIQALNPKDDEDDNETVKRFLTNNGIFFESDVPEAIRLLLKLKFGIELLKGE